MQRCLWLLGSAALYWLAFPNILLPKGFFIAGWLFAIPLFFALDGLPRRQAAAAGFLWGALAHAGLVWWLFPLSWAGAALFVFGLAVQGALFGGLSGGTNRRPGAVLRALYLPSLWVVSEYVRAFLLGGFTWSIGYSQYLVPELIQPARFGGVYAVSWLMLLANAAGYQAPSALSGGVRVAGVLALAWLAGAALSGASPGKGPAQRLALIQPNISRAEKADPALYDVIMERHLAFTRQAFAGGPVDAVFWPETAFPDDVRRDPVWRPRMENEARALGADMVIGSALLADDNRDVNALLWLDRAGHWQGRYDKRQLVPFTEARAPGVFPERILAGAGLSGRDFVAGQKPGVFLFPGSPALGVALCSEEGYPGLFRALVLGGAEVLAAALNDGWFVRPEALYLHGAMGVLRAVETGRPLIRAANTGWTVAVDGRGRVTAEGPPLQKAGVLIAPVRPGKGLTPYGRFGDLFVALTGVFVIIMLWNSRKTCSS